MPFPDIHATLLLLFQYVPVVSSFGPANICWDNGSNRCLVTQSFAFKVGISKHNVVLRMDVVGKKGEPFDCCYYMFELVTSNGSLKKVWAYDLDRIMEPSNSVDLRCVRGWFPYIPEDVFAP